MLDTGGCHSHRGGCSRRAWSPAARHPVKWMSSSSLDLGAGHPTAPFLLPVGWTALTLGRKARVAPHAAFCQTCSPLPQPLGCPRNVTCGPALPRFSCPPTPTSRPCLCISHPGPGLSSTCPEPRSCSDSASLGCVPAWRKSAAASTQQHPAAPRSAPRANSGGLVPTPGCSGQSWLLWDLPHGRFVFLKTASRKSPPIAARTISTI